MYGLRRSEVLGLRWSALTFDICVLVVRRGRVAVSSGTVEGAPKSQRLLREPAPPPDAIAALRVLRTRQHAEATALGRDWSEDRLVAVREDGQPVRPGWYSAEFHRLRTRAGLPRIKLHGNTSVSLMLDHGTRCTPPPHGTATTHRSRYRSTPA